jgi:DNA-binding FadR family transcriptional regulator
MSWVLLLTGAVLVREALKAEERAGRVRSRFRLGSFFSDATEWALVP